MFNEEQGKAKWTSKMFWGSALARGTRHWAAGQVSGSQ